MGRYTKEKNQDTNEKHIAAYGTSLKIEKIYRTDRYCFLFNPGFKREKLVWANYEFLTKCVVFEIMLMFKKLTLITDFQIRHAGHIAIVGIPLGITFSEKVTSEKKNNF